MGDVRKLWIEGAAGRLEAAFRTAPAPRAAAVVVHPHPMHGGTLHNPVIFHSERALNRAGLTTLRFNFRGVGTSEGDHDDGPGEVEDVASAAAWLRGVSPDVPLLLVGYSFGSLCCLRHALDNDAVAAVIAIGLPVRRYSFDELGHLRRPLAVVQGSEDEFGTQREVRDYLAREHPGAQLFVVEGATHLFPGRVRDAADAVAQALEAVLGTP